MNHPLRLFEAIRLGAMLRPQGRNRFLTSDGRSCALGAACEAIGIPMRIDEWCSNYPGIEDAFPILETKHLGRVLEDIIATKNDDGVTREAIADWLEPIELAYEATQQPQSELVAK